jgi:hypothetical protein
VSRAEDYREYALACVLLAQNAATDEDRARLLAMANAWRELAEKISDEDRE